MHAPLLYVHHTLAVSSACLCAFSPYPSYPRTIHHTTRYVTDDDELSHHSASSAYNDGPSTYSPTASSPASPQQRGEVSFAAAEQGRISSMMLLEGCVMLLRCDPLRYSYLCLFVCCLNRLQYCNGCLSCNVGLQ
jgi:hypothetical protein